jgi:DNA-3-methyladenine glycosylase II
MIEQPQPDAVEARRDVFRRGWFEELGTLDAFATLIVLVVSQQLSASAARAIVSHLQARSGGLLPSPEELLALDPHELRASGMSTRKGATLRALAARFADGRLSDDSLARMTDEDVEAALTEVPGIGPFTAHGFLIVALGRPVAFHSQKGT